MSKDKSYKNILDDGVTTYHEDGSKSVTYKNILDGGTTTYHSDGTKSKTYKNILDDGYTTYHEDGTKSRTYRNVIDPGTTTYHEDGSRSRTYKNILDDGYTTYHQNPPYGTSGYGNSYTGGSGYKPRNNTTTVYGYLGYSEEEKERLRKWSRSCNLKAALGFFLPLGYIAARFLVRWLPLNYWFCLVLVIASAFLVTLFRKMCTEPETVEHVVTFTLPFVAYLFYPWSGPLSELESLFPGDAGGLKWIGIGIAAIAAAKVAGGFIGNLLWKRFRKR